MSEESQVRAFYAGKNLFITGGTGFVGLCLIEKILRSIPDVGKIYLLMRPKKGKQIIDRLDEFPKNPVFEKLLETNSTDIFKKLIPVAGDVSDDGLGLSEADRQTLAENVNVVIHSAATLDFQDNLRPTVKINTLGTRKVMELCKQIKNLKVMVQVSSAYVNSYLLEVHEKLYEAPEDVEKVISLVGTLSDEALDEIEPKLLKDHPNTYTFTKHLAEHEVAKCAELFPVTIVRPTMIVASWKEPVPGWTCSKVGPQGFLMGAAKGVVRRLPLSKNNIADYIPVDVVVNQLLVAGWNAAQNKSGLTVYHCSSSTQNPFRWSVLENSVNGMLHKYPLKSAVWYPHLKFVPSLLMFRISAIFVHFFPGFLLDNMLRVTGGKPILMRLHKNVWNSLGRLERFIFTEWKFYNTNTLELGKKLNKTDRELFFIDITGLYWEEYFRKLHLGVRRYLNRESEKTLPAARNKDSLLMRLHKNVWNSLGRLERFIFTEWKFYNTNTLELGKKLNKTDRELFFIDITGLYWEEYFRKLHLGVRRYLNRESEKTLPAARNKDSFLLALHVIWQLLIIYLVWFLFACATGLTMTHSAWIAPIVYILYTFL